MREGSLEAPTRHPIDWQNPEFYDAAKLEEELRRTFDICHGCRRCFNLCESFPKLFDLIDAAPSGELDTVKTSDFQPVIDACTLCDMCFMTKCPYVPPHHFELDFPHLMLRARAVEAAQGRVGFADKQLAETDRNNGLAGLAGPLANWATSEKNIFGRAALEVVAGIHHEAALPPFAFNPLTRRALTPPARNMSAPAKNRRAVIYATCFGNQNLPEIGEAALRVLAHNGVEVEVLHPGCCGMPKLEQGNLAAVAENAHKVAAAFLPYIERGYDVIGLVPSCVLMAKFEWPLIVPGNADIEKLSKSIFDVSEYIVDIARKEGLAEGLSPVPGGVAVHLACHARAQNMGQKAAEMLRLIPDMDVQVIERCSGHGGAWGCKTENFEIALKQGKPVARQARQSGKSCVTSECPLAGMHIYQGMQRIDSDAPMPALASHPIMLIAQAYGF
jgi:glycerol-3-phosphate dehydrogenase subunit C